MTRARQPGGTRTVSVRLTDERLAMVKTAPGRDRTDKLVGLIEGRAPAPAPMAEYGRPVVRYVAAQVAAGRIPS